ncbi:unnamed protein product [Gongylonema pulchrum]|uniref:Glyoxalase domain-containing protein n=1 Tax=Gongylonema pulchrum TaxID=637853 RepID=A0A183E564_9BILA|nr:unnamed protein product [Gongylonema pulchrum]
MMCFQNATSLLGRLSHVSIATSDIDKASAFYKNLGAKVSEKVAVEEMKKQGIRKLSKEASSGAPGKLPIFLNPEDCGGVLIELEQE